MSTPDLAAARQTLTELRAELLARNEELSISADDPLAYDDNFADLGQVTAERGENQLIIASNNEQLTEIDAALARIEDGTYGTCATCGRPIGEARLEVMPTTQYCIDHA